MPHDWNTLRELIAIRGINGKVIVSAELGLNHGGHLGRAMEMISRAADAGCQAVKVQNYRTGDFIKSRKEWIEVDGQAYNAWELFSKCELDFRTLTQLKEHAEKKNLIFHSTPTNEQGVRDVRSLNIPIVKIASDVALEVDLLHYAFTWVPSLVISTGCISLGHWLFGKIRTDQDLLLHCVRKYPTPAETADLKRIGELRLALGKYVANPLVGYSDHTEGIECAVSAVKDYGAVWVEKHFTLDKTLAGPDHRWSADPKDMAELVRCLK